MAGLVASARFHAGALRACSVSPAGTQQGSQLVLPTCDPCCFLIFLSFSHRYQPHTVSYFAISLAQVTLRGRSSVSFLSTCCASTHVGWVLWVNISTTLVIESNLSPLIFIPSADFTSILTVRMLICFVGIRRDGERSHFTDLAFRSLAPPAMWGVDRYRQHSLYVFVVPPTMDVLNVRIGPFLNVTALFFVIRDPCCVPRLDWRWN